MQNLIKLQVISIGVKDLSQILKDMGYDVPSKIYGNADLGEYLRQHTPLTNYEIDDYIKRVNEMKDENAKGLFALDYVMK